MSIGLFFGRCMSTIRGAVAIGTPENCSRFWARRTSGAVVLDAVSGFPVAAAATTLFRLRVHPYVRCTNLRANINEITERRYERTKDTVNIYNVVTAVSYDSPRNVRLVEWVGVGEGRFRRVKKTVSRSSRFSVE